MSKKLLLFISILIYSCQNVDINNVDKRNENWIYWIDSLTGKASWVPVGNQTTIKNGRYISFYKNGLIYDKGKLKNGKKVDTVYCFDINQNLIKYQLIMPDTIRHHYVNEGNYIAYYQNLEIIEKGIVKNHKLGDKWTRYYENGNIEFIQDFKNKDGITKWFYNNGQIKDSAYTIKGKNQGQAKFWYKNGQVREISNWSNGLQHGLYKLYYENGNQKELTNWTNGKPKNCESWYNNGKNKVVKHYTNGLLDSIAKQWYPNGNLEKHLNFSLGKMDGETIKYYENGNIQSEGFYKNGKQNGMFIFYNENGKSVKKESYLMGSLKNIEEL